MSSRDGVTLLEDRCGGAYSGGRWIASVDRTLMVNANLNRAQFCAADDGPSGNDIEAAGQSPDEAIRNLHQKNKSTF